MADHDGQGREALAAELEAFKWPRPPGMDDVAATIVDSDFLKAHDAKVAAATAERIAGVVKEQREKYLDSPTLNPAWVAGWHAATDHIAHHVARADESNPR